MLDYDIKASLRCSDEDKQDLYGANCVFHISVGQPYQEGDRLAATIYAINASLGKCKIVICDSLQRYTFALRENKNVGDFYCAAVAAGDEWLGRNRNIIKLLTIPHAISRWDEWLNHADFNEKYCIIKDLYSNDEEYKDALDKTIEIFLSRFAKRNSEEKYNLSSLFEICRNYLFEECAIIMLLWLRDKYNFVLYPKPRTLVMRSTYDKLIKPYHPKLMRELYVRFRKCGVKKLSY